jgi:Protoporphyrinogen oxidase
MSTRRQFLSAALIGLPCKAGRPITGTFVNESHTLGHRIRDHGSFPSPRRTEKIPIVIVGGGIAGLSAAWRLDKRGYKDFVLLEMEGHAGGNARSGQNEVSAYPWAAHYIPVPNKRATLVRELMEELGVLKEGKWDERYLCFSPQERLFIHGRWQEGLEPELAATPKDREQYRKFDSLIQQFRASGEFTIPMQLGARPSSLDQISMQAWLDQQGFTSPYLRWYIDYSCRDDYGALARDTSAWAGIHYFASREHEEKGPLTWPEGNGWVLKRLLAKLNRYVRTGQPVYRIQRSGKKLRVLTPETEYLRTK